MTCKHVGWVGRSTKRKGSNLHMRLKLGFFVNIDIVVAAV